MRKDNLCSSCKISPASSGCGYCRPCGNIIAMKHYYIRKKKISAVSDLLDEVWIPVIGFEKEYMVSNMGRVKRCAGFIYNKRWGKMYIQEKLLSPACNKGYYYCRLSKENFNKMWLVHRLVAIHHIPNPENKPEVNHLYGKDDNRATSLEWATKNENMEHSVNNGLHKKGESHPKSKLKKEQVMDILKSDKSERKLAAFYGVSRSAITWIKAGKSWNKEYNAYKQLL